MKKVHITLKTALAILITATFLNCKNNEASNKQDDHHHHESGAHDGHDHGHDHSIQNTSTPMGFTDKETGKIFSAYLEIKNALVADDSKKVMSEAVILTKFTTNEVLGGALSSIIETEDIEAQRKAFVIVTEQVENLVKETLSSGEVYKQHCPMAFNNEGGSWLSAEKEIRNPYFGDRMLTCGKVTVTIK